MLRFCFALALIGCAHGAAAGEFDRFLTGYFDRSDRLAAEGRFHELLDNVVHSADLSLVFERRSMYGFETYAQYVALVERLEAEEQRTHVAATGSRDAYRTRRAHLATFASGDLAYATFDAIEDRASSSRSVEDALAAGEFERVTLVFRRIDGAWKLAHAHASYQAPPGPHWPVPKNTSSEPLWDPKLQAEWRRKVCAEPDKP
jgi:hypothetical protein